MRGSAVLVGGDPGIGKSTLLMQAAAALSRRGHRIIYVSGEEAVAQVRLRAQRLDAANTEVLLAAETNVEDILATLAEGKRPDLVIIDSIQTLWSDLAESAPGTVTQVRTGVQAMIRFAKQTGAAMVLVGGDPGIGKSTLLMQAAAALSRRGHKIIYVSGEEAVAQVRLRAQRPSASVWPASSTRASSLSAFCLTRSCSETSWFFALSISFSA